MGIHDLLGVGLHVREGPRIRGLRSDPLPREGRQRPGELVAEWTFRAAGDPAHIDENAHIYAADYGYTYHLPAGGTGSCMEAGIYDPRDTRYPAGAFENTYYKFGQPTNSTAGPYYSVGGLAGLRQCAAEGTLYDATTYKYRSFSHVQPFSYGGGDPTKGRAGNLSVFGLAGGTGNATSNGVALLGSSLIFESEQSPPHIAVTGQPTGWIDGKTSQLTTSATDYGLGMTSLTAESGGDSLFSAAPPGCLSSTLNPSTGVNPPNGKGDRGDRNNRCPRTLPGSVPLSGVAEGKSTVTLRAQDLPDNTAASDVPVNIDNSAPTVTAPDAGSTVRPEAPSADPAPRAIHVSAADGFSGVKSVTAKVDGQDVTVPQPTCTGTDCPATFDVQIPANTLADGQHRVEVTVKDQVTGAADVNARHQATGTFVFTVLHDAKNPPTDPGNGLDLSRKPVTGLGFENWWTYDTTDTGANSSLRANLSTGNTTWSVTPVQNPGVGLNTFLRLTYNSYEPSGLLPNLLGSGNTGVGGYGVAGRGFSVQAGGLTRLNEPLEIRGPAGISLDPSADASLTTSILLTDGDGTEHVFTKDTSKPSSTLRLKAPQGVHLELRRFDQSDPNNRFWAATRPDGTTFFFDRSGYATQVVDRHGNTITYRYDDRAGASNCGWRLLCRRHVTSIVDAAGNNPSGLTGVSQTAAGAETDRAWTLEYDANDRLTVVRDRKKIGTAQRQTKLHYDAAGRLDSVTEDANGPTNQQRTFGLGYDGTSTFLSKVTDPRGADTKVDYQLAKDGLVPGLDQLLGGLGLEAQIRPIKSVADRAATSGAPRTKTYAYADPVDDPAADTSVYPDGNKTRKTSITNARGVVDEVTTDVYGRMTRTDQATSTGSAPSASARRTLQGWTIHNDVAFSTIGAADAAAAVTTEYSWGAALGELKSETQHAGMKGDTGGTSRTATWTYQLTPGVQQGESDAGGKFVYDVATAVDRRGKTTSYDYGSNPNVGDVAKVSRQGAGDETYTYDPRGLLLTHRTQVWGGSKPKPASGFNADEAVASGDKPDGVLQESFGAFDANGLPANHTDERSKLWRTTYDEVGNAIALTDPRDTATTLPARVAPEDTAAAANDPVTAVSGVQSNASSAGENYTARWTYDDLDRQVASATPKRSGVSDATDKFRVDATKYDLNDNVVKRLDPDGHVTTADFTPTDQVSAQSSPSVANHDNGSSDTAPAESAAAANVTRYDYDAVDNLTVKSDPAGGSLQNKAHRTTYTYDAFDEPTAQTREANSGDASITESRAYDARGNVIGETDGNRNGGATPAVAAQNAQNVATERHRYAYDAFDRVKSDTENPSTSGSPGVTSPINLVTAYEYDDEDHLTKKTTPAGRVTSYEFDDRGDMVKEKDPFAYDQSAQSTDTTKTADTTWARRLDGKPYEITAPRGNDGSGADGFVTRLSYYDTGEQKNRGLPKQNGQYGPDWTVQYKINVVGDPTSVYDGRGKRFTNSFLDTGELASTSRPSWWMYDQSTGKIRERTDSDPKPTQAGDGDLPQTTTGGDFGDVTPQKLPDVLPAAGTTTIGYDDDLNVASVASQDDAGSATITQKFDYDALDRLKTRHIPRTATGGSTAANEIALQWQYDADDNVAAEIDGKGQATVYHRDDYDRLVSTTTPGNCSGTGCTRPSTTQKLDRNDNVTSQTTPRADDNADTAAAQTTGKTSATFDVADRATSTTDDSGARTDSEYDRDGQVITAYRPRAFVDTANKDHYATRYTRDGGGRVTDMAQQVTDPDGLETLHTKTTYDRDGNPTRVESPGSASSIGGTANTRVQTRTYDGRDLPYVTTVGSGTSDASSTATEYDGNGWLRRTVKPKGMTKQGDDGKPSNPDVADGVDATQSTATQNAEVREYNDDGLLTGRDLPWGDGDGAQSDDGRQRWRAKYEYTARGLLSRITGVYNDKKGGGSPTHDTLVTYDLAGWPTQTGERDRTEDGAFPADPTDVLEYRFDSQGNQTEWNTPGRTRRVKRTYFPSGVLRAKCGLRGVDGSSAQQEQVYSYRYDTAGDLSLIVDWMHNDPATNSNAPQCAETDADNGDDTLSKRRTQIVNDKAGRQTSINELYAAGKDTLYKYLPGTDDLVGSVATDGKLQSDGTVKGGTSTAYAYDELDRNTKVTATSISDAGQPQTTPAPRVTDMTLWPSGDQRTMTKPKVDGGTARTKDERAFDTRGLLTTRRSTPATGTAQNHPYTYDANGNRTKDERGTDTYNARDQLTHWVRDKKGTSPTIKDPDETIDYVVDGEGRNRKETAVIKANAPDSNGTPRLTTSTVVTDSSRTTGGEQGTSGPADYSGERLLRQAKTVTATAEGATPADPVYSTDCLSYDVFGSVSETKRLQSGNESSRHASCPASTSSSWKTQQKTVYDTFERMTAGTALKHADATGTDAGTQDATEAYCYDALDRRDRRITGLKGAEDPANATDDTGALTRARQACTRASGGTDDAAALDTSYMGTSRKLTRENTSANGVQTYEYTADGMRLGRNRQKVSTDTPQWRAYDTDAQGSVVGLESPTTGAVADDDQYNVDPYGAPVDPNAADMSDDAKANPFRFQGFYQDQSTGTYDMEARSYQPNVGQFLQQDRFADPTGDLGLAADPQTSSRYAFLAGNPASRAEYDGHRVAGQRPGSVDPGELQKNCDGTAACRKFIRGQREAEAAYGRDTRREIAARTLNGRLPLETAPETTDIQPAITVSVPKAVAFTTPNTQLVLPVDPDDPYSGRTADENRDLVNRQVGAFFTGLLCDPRKPLSCPRAALEGLATAGIARYVRGVLAARDAAKAAAAARAVDGGEEVSDAGVVYLRTDRNGGKPYVGRSKSEDRYIERQTEHTREHPDADFRFQVLDRPVGGDDLARLEEEFIRKMGGPTNKSNPDGLLANRRHEMSDRRYQAAGGDRP